ncbi:MAG: dephospho-CoA kinase [Microbacteriaceae bacterium]|jgi:dephospho-CoA kinase|nr:dephospho-CoA kinase [Microbacteriaceae bacterium]
MERVYLIGLTGGIASGKSVVANRLAEHGAVHIDADVLAREVVEPDTPGLAAIVAEFGDGVLLEDGSLNRQALGAMVFSDESDRAKLNAITHPEVWRRTKELIAEAAARDEHAIVVYDVPLLAEAGALRQIEFDLIVVVHADLETRIRRMIELRGMTREEAFHRVNSQASDTERLAIADVVIDNNGSLTETLEQADQLWERAKLQGN